MNFVEVHPAYRARLRRLGLMAATDFLRLQGDILGGHPDRHVLQVKLDAETCYLKKQHRVSWRDRLANWWRGFGFVCQSTREGRLLRQLDAAGIGCPQAIAHGEADGQAFLLLRAETGVTDIRSYLHEHPLQRLALAPALGNELARIHATGFYHRDLYSKHILVGRSEQGWHFCFLDWQRGRRVARVSWLQRLHDLATLDATLAQTMASRRERLLCWSAYLAAQTRPPAQPRKLLRLLCRLSARLQRKRRIRELRQLPLSADRQRLIWLDGEALCVTPEFQQRLPEVPHWLAMPEAPTGNRVECVTVPAEGTQTWRLLRRWTSQPGRWLASWWRRPLFPAPEFEEAAALIRLERYGIEVPRLLALGHRTLRPWQKYSFLLTQPLAGTIPLLTVLRTAAPNVRWPLLRQAGQLLRRVHEAGYKCRSQHFDGWAVRPETGAIVLTSVDDLRRHKMTVERLARIDFIKLARTAFPGLSAADKLRFFLGYHALPGLTKQAHHLARRLSIRDQAASALPDRERRVA